MLDLLLLLSLCLPAQSGGVEAILEKLVRTTAADRERASQVWEAHGPLWLLDPTPSHFAPLAAEIPAIQEPLLLKLEEHLGLGKDATRVLLLSTLQRVLSPSGAERLVDLVADLPPSIRIEAYRAALARGSRGALPLTETWLTEPATATSAFFVLAESGPLVRAAQWIDAVANTIPPDPNLSAALELLAERHDGTTQLNLPKAWLDSRQPQLIQGVLRFLTAYPSRHAEALVLEAFLEIDFPGVTRSLALNLANAQTKKFHWPRVKRMFSRHLKSNPNDPLATDLAWTLHSLGDRSGRKFLIGDLEARTRRNPTDWRLKMKLGARLVDLAEFSAAYKEFRPAVLSLKGTPTLGQVQRKEWLAATRAACGSRHFDDGETWLRNARMSPRELAPFRDLPEFEDALKRAAFRRLFGIR